MTTASIKNDTKTPIRNAISNILDVLATFTALLNEETAALKRSDFETVDRLQPEKRMIARLYADQVTSLSERAAEVQKIEASLQEKLIRARKIFTDTLTDNMKVLELVKLSTQRLTNRILDIARLSVVDTKQTSYGMQGHVQSYKTASLSSMVDQSL